MRALPVAASLVLVASCTSSASQDGPETTVPIDSSSGATDAAETGAPRDEAEVSLVVLTAEDGMGILDGLIQGRYVVRDGCVYIESGSPVTYRAAVWPAGTRLDADGASLILPDGYVLEPSDLFEATGGLVEDSGIVSDLATPDSAAAFIDACGDPDAAFLVSNTLRPFE